MKTSTILLTAWLVVGTCGCFSPKSAPPAPVTKSEILETVLPIVDKKVETQIKIQLPAAINTGLRQSLGDILYEQIPWLIAVLAGGGGVAGVMRAAKQKKELDKRGGHA